MNTRKRFYLIFTMAILFLTTFMGCQNPANSGTGDGSGNTQKPDTKFEKGWYKYTTTVNSISQNYYFYYDENKSLSRAGNETNEFTGTVFKTYKTNTGFSWETLSKAENSDNITFKKIEEDKLPDWTGKSSAENIETQKRTKLSELANSLEEFLKGTSRKNDTIEISNIDSTIETDNTNNIYITASIKFDNAPDSAEKYLNFSSQTFTTARFYIDDSDDKTIILVNLNDSPYSSDAKTLWKNNEKYYYIKVDMSDKELVFYYAANNVLNLVAYEKNNNQNEENDNKNINALLIGTWYCSDAELFSCLIFNEGGTGKACVYDNSDNYSSFSWSVDKNEITMEGDFKNTNPQYSSKTFSVSADELCFEKLNGLSNLKYTRQE